MGSNPWDCVCEFLRQQSAELANVLLSQGNQNTISDLDTTTDVALTNPTGISPWHFFVFFLLAVWGYLFLRKKREETPEKPRPNNHDSSNGSGSSGSEGSGGPGDGELF